MVFHYDPWGNNQIWSVVVKRGIAHSEDEPTLQEDITTCQPPQCLIRMQIFTHMWMWKTLYQPSFGYKSLNL